jgi:hypothetical protein
MQSRVCLGNSLVEGLALRRRNVELELSGLAGTVASGEGTCAPWGAAVDLLEVGEHACCAISIRHMEHRKCDVAAYRRRSCIREERR